MVTTTDDRIDFVDIALVPRLLAFDGHGDLVDCARQVADLISEDREEAAEVFWTRYIELAPSAHRPSDEALSGIRERAAAILETMFRYLDDQSWADAMHVYWTLTTGNLDAVTAVRAAFTEQYIFIRKIVVARTTADGGRCARLLDALGRVSGLADCILGLHLGEVKARKRADDRARNADLFRHSIESGVRQASAFGGEIRDRAMEASSAMQGLLANASNVASAAGQAARSMVGAANTAAGLVQTIAAVKVDVEIASDVADRASEQVAKAIGASEALIETTKSVESILQLIRDVAAKTNLLSLNATIEASRAGESGRGFAVVAQEVKSLARQVAVATEEIAEQILAIHAATDSTMKTNSALRDAVSDVRSAAARICDRMTLQSNTVAAILEAVDQTASAAESMSDTIVNIREDAEIVTKEISALEQGFAAMSRKLDALQSAAREYTLTVA